VSLTTGRGPLGADPAGRFSAPVPAGIVYVEPFPRRVRGLRDGTAVVDSERVVLVHAPGQPPFYGFPEGDVGEVAAQPLSEVPGYVRVPWETLDAWYEEDEQVFGHPRNPYHRIDCLRAHRRLRVELGTTVLVDTTNTLVLHETTLAPRLYVDRRHVVQGVLTASTTTTYCPYKGTASYWSAIVDGDELTDVAWSYEDPYPESAPIRGLLSFYGTKLTVSTDLPAAVDLRRGPAADIDVAVAQGES